MSSRLTLAFDTGLPLPSDGQIGVFHPRAGMELELLPRDRVRIIQPLRPDHDAFAALGYVTAPRADPADRFALSLVCLPRAKSLARALVAQAAACTDGLIVVDGAKTDGIDSLLRDTRKRTDIAGQLSKAHGKLFWFAADPDAFADWQPPEVQTTDGFRTAPGVFSADGIDPASQLLARHLPHHVGNHVADLGAGWGYLSAHLLQDPKLQALHLVEADHAALDCARHNLTDPRARFHWADALTWVAPGPVDAVVMNPPFHNNARAADPGLGRGFIETAARLLPPRGQLWMVANRHLPYEQALAVHFAQTDEIAGDNRFKILHAARPSRPRR